MDITGVLRPWLAVLALGCLAAGAGCSGCSDPVGGQECTTSDDCPKGFFCDTLGTGRCRPSGCQEHSDCPLMYLCSSEGECYDPYDGTRPQCWPPHPGCPCEPQEIGAHIDCEPPDQPAGVDKSCHYGRSFCDGERLGPCEDTYMEDCNRITFGPGDIRPTEENSSNVVTGVEGELQLQPDERQVDFGFLWVANTGENTVSKIDVDTGREVARYAAALPVAGLPQGPIPYPSTDPWNDCQHCPSRTAIDFRGDAYVANRAFGLQGSVTKFANNEIHCEDLDGNGHIDTSWDANGDGVIDVNDPAEFFGVEDECILWTVAVGNSNGIPRAIAIDSGSVPDYGSFGNVWVGIYNERRAVMLNGDTGEQVASVNLDNGSLSVHPYGAAVDAWGFVWFGSLSDGTLAQVDTIGANLVDIHDKQAGSGCPGAYGIAIDVKGRIWQGGYDCNTAERFDPVTGVWDSISFAGAGRGGTTRGIAPDLAGTVWVAHTDGYVSRFDAETLDELESFALPHHLGGAEAVNNTVGVGIDRNGACWAVSINRNYQVGSATRIQPGGAITSFPVGLFPYTYSDFTGFGLTTVTRPSGWYNMVVAGCENMDPLDPERKTDWQRLTWNEIEPPGTNVRMRIKVADTVAELATAAWWGPYDHPDVDLDAIGLPDSDFMLLQVLLSSSDPEVTPGFVGFDLTFDCGGGVIPD